MGESSPKSLRGGGMDDVIFAGTASRPARDFAEVSILLERAAAEAEAIGAEPGESEVTRRIERGLGLGLSDRRARRPRQGRRLAVRRRRDRAHTVRRWSARARSARSSPPSRSSGASCSRKRLAFPGFTRGARTPNRNCARPRPTSPGWRKSSATRNSAPPRSAARRAPPSAIASSPTRSAASRRACSTPAGARPSAPPAAATADARRAEDKWRRSRRSIAEAQAVLERANAALADKREAPWRKVREQGHELAHQLASARAKRDTVSRRLAELERLDSALAGDMAREQALRAMPTERSPNSKTNGTAIEARLGQSEGSAQRIARELTRARGIVARGRGGTRRSCSPAMRRCAPSGGSRRPRSTPPGRRSSAALRSMTSSPSRSRRWATARPNGRRAAMPRRAALRRARRWPRPKRRGLRPKPARATAAEERDLAESRLAAARAAFSAASSEHDALARALDQGGSAAIASLRAEPGYERALAAALGEDSDAAVGGDSPRRWAGAV